MQGTGSFAANVRELVIMGGSINGRGNITPAAEYNIYVDPEAADIVVRAGFPRVRFVTWDPLTVRDTVFDWRATDAEANSTAIESVDGDAFFQYMRGMLGRSA